MNIRVAKSEAGTWVELPEFGKPPVAVLIKSSDDIEFRRASTAGYQPHQKALRTGRLIDPAAQDRIVARAAAKALILDWKNVVDDAGEPVPFSREQALEYAEDPDYTKFFRAIEREADFLANATAEERIALGNS